MTFLPNRLLLLLGVLASLGLAACSGGGQSRGPAGALPPTSPQTQAQSPFKFPTLTPVGKRVSQVCPMASVTNQYTVFASGKVTAPTSKTYSGLPQFTVNLTSTAPSLVPSQGPVFIALCNPNGRYQTNLFGGPGQISTSNGSTFATFGPANGPVTATANTQYTMYLYQTYNATKPPLLGTTNIYVADQNNKRIVKMDDMTGANWTTYGVPGGSAPFGLSMDSFNRILAGIRAIALVRIDDITGKIFVARFTGTDISGIALDTSNRIYWADGGEIYRMDDMSGTNLVALQGPSNQERFYDPNDIAVDGAGHIYVTDGILNAVVRIDDMTGANWTTYSGPPGDQLSGPTAIALDGSNRIYIHDGSNGRLVRMNDMTGAGWTTFTPSGGFGASGHISFDSAGRVYLADSNSRILRVDDMIGTNFTTFGSLGSGTGQFNSPWGIWVQ